MKIFTLMNLSWSFYEDERIKDTAVLLAEVVLRNIPKQQDVTNSYRHSLKLHTKS